MNPLRRGPLQPIRAWAFVSAIVLLGLPSDRRLAAHSATSLPSFDFTQASEAQAWQAAHDLAPLESTSAGLRARITGSDPYLTGPPRDYPPGKLLWLRVRLKSDQGGEGQVFYFQTAPAEASSVRFAAPGGVWCDVQVPLPALGPGYRLRLDPPGDGGACVFGRLDFEERNIFAAPAWPQPRPPVLGTDALAMQAGDLKLLHNRTEVGGFRLRVGSREAGIGNPQALLGYVITNEVRWMPFGHSPGGAVEVQPFGGGLRLQASWPDPDGARWSLSQTFLPAGSNAISFEGQVSVDQDRAVLYLPLFTFLPGVGTHGTNKTQGLLAGVEYLENEPSSSEADLVGPESQRLVPDTLKVTFPLMALAADGHYVGLMWEPTPGLCVAHDSPDRQFASGGHLFELLYPGSDGVNRKEGSLLPYRPETLAAGQPLSVRALLVGGPGNTVVPAIQDYLRRNGLPPAPQTGYTAPDYFELAARGWLESRIRETNLYRHAWWPGFKPQPSADAAVWMLWLSAQPSSSALAGALTAAASDALNAIPNRDFNTYQVGHNRYPLPALVFGSVIENARRARDQGLALLGRFEPDGSVLYQPSPGGVSYGATHWARDANGLTAGVVESLLEAAVFSGDRSLRESGLRHVRALDKFRDTVPRGAQTWEIPLHTPDILAAAHLVRAYVLGYEMTGETSLLEQARYWAWTGVPFIYLTPPTPQPVGLYSTIPVLGATGWHAPVWIGRPVQWCGLVYAEALRSLASQDPAGPWTQLADGICAAGLQHTWPLTEPERKGLLPDFYLLRLQRRDGPAINPATLFVPAMPLFGEGSPYAFHVFRRHGLFVHAPGALDSFTEGTDSVSFRVKPWLQGRSQLLVSGVRQMPQVTINARAVILNDPRQFEAADGWLVLYLEGTSTIHLGHRALATVN